MPCSKSRTERRSPATSPTWDSSALTRSSSRISMVSSRLARSSTTRAETIFVRLAGGSGSSAFCAKSSVPVEMSVTKTASAEIGGGDIGW